MRVRLLALALLAGTLTACHATAAEAPGNHRLTLQVGGQERTGLLRLPPAYDGQRALPAVIVFHGSGINGAKMAGYCGFTPLADRDQVIMVYPDGLSGQNHGWNAIFGEPAAGQPGARADRPDDLGFVRALIALLRDTYHADPKRIFVCGHSSGAYMAYRVANDLPDLIAAAGVVNGSMTIRLLDGQPAMADLPAPPSPVSILHVCGAKDRLVKFEGGRTDRVIAWSVPQCLQHFITADGCAAEGQTTRDAEHAVKRTVYAGGKAGTEVELVVVEQADHSWPFPAVGLSATQELWDFFGRHPKPAA